MQIDNRHAVKFDAETFGRDLVAARLNAFKHLALELPAPGGQEFAEGSAGDHDAQLRFGYGADDLVNIAHLEEKHARLGDLETHADEQIDEVAATGDHQRFLADAHLLAMRA